MRRWMCCYTVVEYSKNGNISGVYSDCFSRRAKTKADAEAQTRTVAMEYNPDRLVHIVLVKEM